MFHIICNIVQVTAIARTKLGKASTRTRIGIRGTSSDKMKEERRTGSRPHDRNACIALVGNNRRKKVNSRPSRRYLSNIGPTGDPALASITLFIIVYFILLLIQYALSADFV